MTHHVFDPRKLEKLNNPERHHDFPLADIALRYEISSPQTIVDVGAGTGFFSICAAECFPNARVLALDISPEMISYMKTHCSISHPHIHPMQISDTDIHLDSTSADLILMVNLHHELPDCSHSLAECYRILRPGKHLLVSDWKMDAGPGGPPRSSRIPVETVRSQLEVAGFECIGVETDFPRNYLIVAQKRTSGSL
ncbi:hypothetical protein GEMRC1_005581 [Eukaryota sp. GEM-RC1]